MPEVALDRGKFSRIACEKFGINTSRKKGAAQHMRVWEALRKGGHYESEITDCTLKSSMLQSSTMKKAD
jgi:hypothetical protein